MTGADNAHLFAAIPLLSCPNTHTISALISHKSSLVIGLDPFLLLFVNCELSTQSKPRVISRKQIQPPDLSSSTILGIRSFCDHLLIHTSDRNTLRLLQGESKLVRIQENVTAMAVNQFSAEPLLAFSVDRKVIVKKLGRSGSIDKYAEQSFDSPILGLALAAPRVCVVTPGSIYLMRLDKQPCPEPCPIECRVSFTFAIPGRFFICANQDLSFVLDEKLSAQGATMVFDKKAVDHAYGNNLVASVVEDKSSQKTADDAYGNVRISDFQSTTFVGRCFLANARRVCFLDKFFLVGTDRSVFLLLDGSAVMEDPSWVPGAFPELPLAVFDQLWMSGTQRRKAIKMLGSDEFSFAWMDVIRLFPFLLPRDIRSRLLAPPGGVSLEDALVFAKVLMKLRVKDQRTLVNSVIIQLLAYSGNRQLFVSFVDGKPCDTRLVEAFFEETKNPLYPYYLRCVREFQRAIEIFKAADDRTAVRDTLVLAGTDLGFVESHLGWLLRVDPLLAFSVFSDPRVPGHLAIKFVSEKYPQYDLAVLWAVLEQRDLPNREPLVKSYVFRVCSILASISTPTFDRSSIRFCEPVILNKAVDLETVSVWLTDRLVAICRRDRPYLPISEIRGAIDGIPTQTQLLVFRELGQPDAAMDLLQDWTGDLAPFENICHDYPRFFPTLFTALHDRLTPESFRHRLCALITDHLFVMDVPTALSYLDSDLAVPEVADFLEKTFAALSSKRISQELRAAFLEGDAFESTYDKVVREAVVVELTRTSVCASCRAPLGFNFVERQPGGLLFHFQCLH
jgi:hypothetical protein